MLFSIKTKSLRSQNLPTRPEKMWIKWISGVDNHNLSTKWEKVVKSDASFLAIVYFCFASKLEEV